MRNILFACLVFCAFSLSAQVKIRPGIKAGLNSSNITNYNSEAKQDFYAGAFVVFKFTDFYHLQPELTYSKQGFISKNTHSNNSKEVVNLDYLSLAVTNKFFLKKTGLHAIIGPTLDFKVNNMPHYLNNYDFSRFDDFMIFDFTLFVGIGYELPLGLALEARYKHGFFDINGDNFNQEVQFSKLNVNQVFQIGIGYSF